MSKYSRSQWAQITKRVRKADFTFTAWKCLVCGHDFNHHSCVHSVQENEAVVEKVKEEFSINS